jgi:hypothetical protein
LSAPTTFGFTRARVPDCFELGTVDGRGPRRVASDSSSGRLSSDSVFAQQAAEPVATVEEIELRQLSSGAGSSIGGSASGGR